MGRFEPALAGMLLTLVTAATAVAGQDTRGVAHRQEGLTVIEEKCLVCHNRQRIDAALREQKDMAAITRAMEQKGARLTPSEQQVLGIYWQQNPFRGKGDAPAKTPEAPRPSH